MPEYLCVCPGTPKMVWVMESKTTKAYACTRCGRLLLVQEEDGCHRMYAPETSQWTKGPAVELPRRIHADLELLSRLDPVPDMEKVRDELDDTELWLHGYLFVIHTDS